MLKTKEMACAFSSDQKLFSQAHTRQFYFTLLCLYWFPLFPAALVPGQVQNLRSTLDTNIPSLTLNWDKPSNVKTAEEVTAYDIRFKPAGSWWRKDYHKMTVYSPATSIYLTRENGLNPRIRYEFEVRAQNDHSEGEWNKVSKYIGMFIQFIMLKCSSKVTYNLGECTMSPLPVNPLPTLQTAKRSRKACT